MKKILITCTLALLAGVTAHANIILSDSFTYPDGDIATASGSPWLVHSGTTPASILTNELRLTGGNSADVNALLAGGPYLSNSVAVLYSSFKMRVTSQPGAAGTYFAHFKDTNSGAATGFGGRVWLNNTNAYTGAALANNEYRVGIANGTLASSISGQIDVTLTLNTTYTIVTRFLPNTGLATIWLNPAVETDPNVTANDPGTAARPNPIDVVAYAFRQSGGIGVVLVDDLKVGTTFADVAGANVPPSISGVPTQRVAVGVMTPVLAFTVGDAETAAESLIVSASSSNQGLVPNANIELGGSGSNRTVKVTPVGGQQGTATITLSVTDDGGITANTAFQLAVGIPTISDIPSQSTPSNTVLGPITFTVGDTETAAGSLTVTATSANQTLVPDANISLGGSDALRSITITPAADQNGLATITVTVSDGTSSASDTFVLTVNPLLGVLRSDDFNRTGGPLVNFDGLWLSNGGAGGTNIQQMQIIGGQLKVLETQSEDCSTELPPNQPSAPVYTPASGTILYASMSVNFSSLPTPGGDYFAHFKDDTLSGFRARIFASRANASTGHFRFGIANNAAAITAAGQIPVDVATNESHTLVVRFNCGTGESRLWLDPASEASPSVSAADAPAPLSIVNFTIRQNAGIGVLCLDNLKIGTAFSDVIAPQTLVRIRVDSGTSEAVIEWDDPADELWVTDELASSPGSIGWVRISAAGATSFRVAQPAGNAFFALGRGKPEPYTADVECGETGTWANNTGNAVDVSIWAYDKCANLDSTVELLDDSGMVQATGTVKDQAGLKKVTEISRVRAGWSLRFKCNGNQGHKCNWQVLFP